MPVALSRFALSGLPLPPARKCRALIGSCLSLVCLSGCHATPTAPAATAVVSARSLSATSPAIVQVQSSPLYRQARQFCQRHDYRQAADLLTTLAKTPGLAPDAAAFCTAQRDLCLKDAGLPVSAAPTLVSAPVRPPQDADCGPRALLLLCQRLGVKTDLETLRKTSGTTSQGTTLAGLQQAAQKLGLKAEGVQVSRDALPETATPAIAWTNCTHYVALLALNGSSDKATATISDPNKPAEEIISQEQLLQRCGGYLLLVHR